MKRETKYRKHYANILRGLKRRGSDEKTLERTRWLLYNSSLCAYCGDLCKPMEKSIDHYLPLALGGATGYKNLVLAHARCNKLKGQIHPDDYYLLRQFVIRVKPESRADIERRLLAGGRIYGGY